MSDFFNNLLNLFFDSSKPQIKKFIFLFMLVLTALLVDNIVGFSYYYRVSKKLEQTAQIEELRLKAKGDPEISKNLRQIELDIIAERNIIQASKVFLKSVSFPYYDIDQGIVVINGSGVRLKQISVEEHRKRLYRLTLSSSFFFIAALLFAPLVILMIAKGGFFERIFFFLMTTFTVGIVVIVNTYLFLLLPKFEEKFWYNYPVNALLHLLELYFLFGVDRWINEELKRRGLPFRETTRAMGFMDPILPQQPVDNNQENTQ